MVKQCRKRGFIMSKITKIQTYAIQWLNHINKTTDEIASELDLTIKQVDSVLEKNQKATSDNQIKTSSSVVGDKKKNLMIMETSVKKNRSVAIMTKEASYQVDENRKNANGSQARKTSDSIYRPKDKK